MCKQGVGVKFDLPLFLEQRHCLRQIEQLQIFDFQALEE